MVVLVFDVLVIVRRVGVRMRLAFVLVLVCVRCLVGVFLGHACSFAARCDALGRWMRRLGSAHP